VNLIKNCALSVSILAVAAGLTASQANAQALKGTFNLPFEAHWSTAVLEPGEYRMVVARQPSTLPIIYLTSQGKTVMVLVGTSRAIPESDRSYLRVEKIGQAHVIREFNSGVTGNQLIFLVPKSVKNEVALASNREDTTIPLGPAAGN
jgi:hypothetical protein